jgi:SAM-dependent methyltransferase
MSGARVPRIDIEKHNREQIRYFERAGKEAMRPVSSPYVERQVDELVAFADLAPGDRVLEVGCGMGRYTLPLAERRLRVEGLDLSERLLSQLASFNAGRYEIPLYCADILDPPRGLDETFDAVVGFFTLHHLHDVPSCFRAMARLAKPGGRVVFLEPNPLNVLYYVQIVVAPGMTWQGDRGILNMRPRRIFRAMEAAGLTHLSMTRFGFFPPVLTNRAWGARLERILEDVPWWKPILPFQLFRAERAR